MQMDGRTVLVTGASSGIGRETAVMLSELGARVILSARSEERLAETRRQLTGEGHAVEAMDLGQADGIPAWIRRIVERHGPLSGLVHSAGIQQTMPIQLLTPERIASVMHVNVTSAIILVRAFRQKGCAAARASLVLISGGTAIVGRPGISVYSASKAALMGFVKSAALELATADGMRLNCVAPAYVETEMVQKLRDSLTPEQFAAIEQLHPLGLGRPRDVAGAIAYLLAETGRWITGTTLIVDGGSTCGRY
jgi:NAD(P)-dependent dehydrogenase (short-subunit alcohol dehydrogenase family)